MNQSEQNTFLEAYIAHFQAKGVIYEKEVQSLRQEIPSIIARYQSDPENLLSLEHLTQKAIEEWAENSIKSDPVAQQWIKDQGLGDLLE
jgi:hypothetical protein